MMHAGWSDLTAFNALLSKENYIMRQQKLNKEDTSLKQHITIYKN